MSNSVLKQAPSAEAMRRFLADRGVGAFIVGGYIRDTLLGRATADLDIAVRGDAMQEARGFAGALGGRFVPLDEANKVARVVFADNGGRLVVDFSGYVGAVEDDLARRDFTVNAMALPLERWPGELRVQDLVDPFGGVADLERRVLRRVNDAVFQQDPARLLRAVRLTAELDFTVHPDTARLMGRDAALVGKVAGERLREELVRVLALHGAFRWVSYMHELGLLLAVFPELAPARGFEQRGQHYWDVLGHSLRAVGAVEYLLRQGEWEYGDGSLLSVVPWSEDLEAHFAEVVGQCNPRSAMLKLAALFHDSAKPGTKTVGDDSRWHFLGHAALVAAKARQALERLRFSAREVKLVETEIEHHLRPAQMTPDDLPTARAVFRYYRDLGEAAVDVLFLALGDWLSTRGPDIELAGWGRQARVIAHILEEGRRQESTVAPPKLIDGHDIMGVFGLKPGPRLGVVLAAVREAQAAGEVSTREDALELARRQLSSMKD